MTIKSILAGVTLAASLGTVAFAQDTTKVGFIYVGPVGDGGWSYEHNQGRLAVEEHFGDAVETVFVESVPEGADAERVLQQMALYHALIAGFVVRRYPTLVTQSDSHVAPVQIALRKHFEASLWRSATANDNVGATGCAELRGHELGHSLGGSR